MNILSQFFNSHTINSHFADVSTLYQKLASPFSFHSSISNYTDSIQSISSSFQILMQKTFVSYLENIDSSFRNSPTRKERYYVKVTRSRSLITPFGLISYNRTIYSFKDKTPGCYCHVDSIMNLPKYDRFDPCVKAMIVDLYADSNSMIKVGKILGERIFSPFSFVSIRKQFSISRQTVFNTLKQASVISIPLAQRKNTPEVLYIMADEKFVPLQEHNNIGNPIKQMIKAAVVFEDIENIGKEKKRHKLINKYIHLSCESNFWPTLHDCLNELYDLEKISHISIMGDGAAWIKKGQNELSSATCKVTFSLDKFHFNQALTRIEKDENIRKYLFDCITVNQDKKLFQETVQALKENNPIRANFLSEQENYILNNWKYIQHAYHKTRMPCSMESAISHYIASSFTSVAKGYGKQHIGKYVRNRMHYLNGVDIQQMYLDSLDFEPDEKNHIVLKYPLDFSIFEPRHEYQTSSTSRWMMKHTDITLRFI